MNLRRGGGRKPEQEGPEPAANPGPNDIHSDAGTADLLRNVANEETWQRLASLFDGVDSDSDFEFNPETDADWGGKILEDGTYVQEGLEVQRN